MFTLKQDLGALTKVPVVPVAALTLNTSNPTGGFYDLPTFGV